MGITSDGPLPDALGLFNSITSQIGGAIVNGGQQIATGVGNAASAVGNWWDNFLNSPPGWGQPDCACGGGLDGGDDNDLPDGLPDDEFAPGI